MKSAIVYVVNSTHRYVKMLVNSVNSLYDKNKDLIDSDLVQLFIICDMNVDLSKINRAVKYTIIDKLSYDYSLLQKVWRLTKYAYYRWEIFGNPIFLDFDNVLYIDVDTEITGDLGDLLKRTHEPGIYTSDVEKNWLHEQGEKFMNTHRYCNSGVILLTPKLIGKELLCDIFLRLVREATETKFKFADQCAMNYVLNDEKYNGLWKKLDCKYNYCTGTSFFGLCKISDIRILHHAGGIKKPYELKYLQQ